MTIQATQTYVRARLERWAVYVMWKLDLLTKAPGPAPLTSWYFPMVMRPSVRVQRVPVVDRGRCPVDAIEGGATDICVDNLHAPYRQAIAMSYLGQGTAAEKSMGLGCSRRTFFYHLDHAHAELLGLFNDYEAGLLRVDVDEANVELELLRRQAPVLEVVPIQASELHRPAMHGISRAVRIDDCK